MRDARLEEIYGARTSARWADRLRRWLTPPLPLIANPREPKNFPLGRWNLYIGGGGGKTPGYVNLDLFLLPGVDVAADAEHLPFRDAVFTRVECDAVLEHVQDPPAVMREIERVLAPGGYAHIVVPFCHPFHEYPKDYRRFTPDGLRLLRGRLEVVDEGWRTGPTATLLVFVIEYVKMLGPGRIWRMLAHGVLGWLLFPLRYLDLWLLRRQGSSVLGNHCYVWLRKAE
jgi:SAM-dependent methyltransferase